MSLHTFQHLSWQADVVATTAATTVAGTTARPVVRKAATTVGVTTTVAGTTGAASKAVAPSGKVGSHSDDDGSFLLLAGAKGRERIGGVW